MIDIHCHVLPGIDDGPATWEDSLAMARMAADDGVSHWIATPHQLGQYRRNSGATIRGLVSELNRRLASIGVDLQVMPGADVRIEADMIELLTTGDVLTLGDHGRHVLLELPHELYFPLEPLLAKLKQHRITGILSHPERNHGILETPAVLQPLIDAGCLMQVTAGSITGAFGDRSRALSESMLAQNQVHFVASDGHGTTRRRPRMKAAFQRVSELTDPATAIRLFVENPRCVANNQAVPEMAPSPRTSRHRWCWSWRGYSRATGTA